MEGRLGLETARVPHVERHGLLWLEHGKLYVEAGTLCFATAGTEKMEKGRYDIPYQTISNIILGPGTSITHDVLRLLARHGTGLVATGVNGVRFYASMPFGPDRSELARIQTELWADEASRVAVARKMYFLRLGELLPHQSINALRGAEGKRMKQVYKRLAKQYSIEWKGRSYDRENPDSDDTINTAINHASAAVRAAAMVAVASTGTIPQLGFIHETSGVAFALDIADLFRDSITLPVAFQSAKEKKRVAWKGIEQLTRARAGTVLHRKRVIPAMIDSIKEVLNGDDVSSNQKCS